MRYTPHTPADKERMLRAVGPESIDELFRHIPASLRQRAYRIARLRGLPIDQPRNLAKTVTVE